MDFNSDIHDYIKGEFEYFGIEYKPTKDINRDLLDLFNFHKKYVFPFPREVEFSKELMKSINDRYSKYNWEVMNLKTLFENRGNVNPFQSKDLFNPKVPDHLVYAWGIYHFHLSAKRTEHPFFNDRTKEVLFIYITKEKALFLDIDTHQRPYDVFGDEKFLKIIDDNWQGILVEPNMSKGSKLTHNLNRSERHTLRKHGVNEGAVEVNGRLVYPPGFGVASSKNDCAQQVRLVHDVNRWLIMNRENINANKKAIDSYFIKTHGLKNNIEYKLVFTNEGPQIIDKKTGTCLIKYGQTIKL